MLAREWQIWAAENLLRGVLRAEIAARLDQEGVPKDVAACALDELAASPFLEAARPFVRGARRFTMAARREEMLRRGAASPRAIARRAGVPASEFFDTYYASGTPVVLTDLVPRWPLFGRASPRALAERFGDVEVEITVGRVDDSNYARTFRRRTERLSMREFVARIEAAHEPESSFYMVAQNKTLERTPLRAMLDEIDMPEGYIERDRLLVNDPPGASLWMGPAGTVTALHHDFTNLLFCALHGRKRWRLVPPLERALLDRVSAQHTLLDPERDLPPDVPMLDVTLAPGEALFVPVGWWHHVVALDASVGISLAAFPGAQDFGFFRLGDP